MLFIMSICFNRDFLMTRAYNSIKMFYYYASISRGKIEFHKAAENKKTQNF